MRPLSPLPLLAALALAATPAAAAEPIRVGALLSVTGPAAFLGGPEQRTLEMAVEELNARGGLLGRPVRLVVKDTAGSPEKAVSLARQLIDEEQVFAIIGPATSGETMAVKALAESSGTLLLSCAAAEVIVNPVARWVFKTAQKDSHAAAMIFQEIRRRGLTRVAVLTSNTGFGKAGKEQLERLAPEHGLQVVASETYDKAATDLTAEVTKVKAAGAQALVNWSIEPAQAIVLKNARQLGLGIPIFQSHGFGNVQYVRAAGAAADGVVFPMGRVVVAEALPDRYPQKAVLVAYKRAYEARFKEDVSGFGGYAYDALLILAQATRAAGTLDRERVRAAVEGIKGLTGVSGTFNLSPTDHNGLAPDSFELLTVKDGKFAILGAR